MFKTHINEGKEEEKLKIRKKNEHFSESRLLK